MIKIIRPYLIFLENKYLNKNISLLQHRIDYNAADLNYTIVTNGNNLIARSCKSKKARYNSEISDSKFHAANLR